MPERLAIVSTESGTSQAWAYDVENGERRQASAERASEPKRSAPHPRRLGIVWWLDPQGDERGRWMVTPFEGGDPAPLFPGLPDMWMSGLSLVDDSRCRRASPTTTRTSRSCGTATNPREVYRQRAAGRRGTGLATRAWRTVRRRTAARDLAHRDLHHREPGRPCARRHERAIRSARSSTRGWRSWPRAGPRRRVTIASCSIARSEASSVPGCGRPGPACSTRSRSDVPGTVTLADWYPTGDALLLHRDHEATHSLLRVDLSTGALTTIVDRGGTIGDAGVRPGRPGVGSSRERLVAP